MILETSAETLKNLRALALDELNRARFLDPNNDNLLYDLSFIYAESREIPLAIKTVRSSLKLSNGQPAKWHLLALLHTARRNYDAALEVCEFMLKDGANMGNLK